MTCASLESDGRGDEGGNKQDCAGAYQAERDLPIGCVTGPTPSPPPPSRAGRTSRLLHIGMMANITRIAKGIGIYVMQACVVRRHLVRSVLE
mgnify:CR=1 FL=1